jgi:ribosomal protein L11 methyltransferase
MEEFYNQLIIKVSSHYDLFSDFLNDTLPIGFEEKDGSFIVRSEDELDTIAWGIEQFGEALQKALGEPISVDIKITKEKNSDWVKRYQEAIVPIEIDSFYIYPSWEKPKEDKINIKIDPALAFGTGHHPTTSTCISAIGKYVHEGDTLLDVGCGSGILGICAMKLGAVVDSCDTDHVSVENAEANAQNNDVKYENIWHGSASLATKRYDVIVANIVADVLEFIASDLITLLKPGGTLILSGIILKYEDKVLSAYKALDLITKIEQNEWITIILQKDK